jgi:hypothetical protein
MKKTLVVLVFILIAFGASATELVAYNIGTVVSKINRNYTI